MSPIGIIYSEYDMDSGYVFAKFITGDIVLIDCDEMEKTYADNIYDYSGSWDPAAVTAESNPSADWVHLSAV